MDATLSRICDCGGTNADRTMRFVFEAEYQIENGRANWMRSLPVTCVFERWPTRVETH